MRRIVKTFLESAGYEVSCAENGEMAYNEAMRRHYDIIVTDIDMPVMSGLELASRLRQTQRHQHTPIIMMTAGTTRKGEGIKRGISGWLRKPFSKEKMISAVTRVISENTSSA